MVEKGVQGPIISDSNEYFPDNGNTFNWKDSVTNFEGWKRKSGGDAKSIVADPRLRAQVPQRAEDLALRGDSPAIGRGENLGPELADALTVQTSPRGGLHTTKQSAKWDLGAVQHSP